MPPLITFSTINNMLISVKRANFTLIFFKATCHANPVAEKILWNQIQILWHI